MSASPSVRRAAEIVLLFAIVTAVFAFAARREMRDFEVYWTAAGRAAAAEPLYRVEDGHYRFKYLPAFAVVAAPLSRVPLPVARVLWIALTVGCLFALVHMSARGAQPTPVAPAVLVTLAVLAMAKFLAHEIVLGQVNILFAALCVAALRALLRGQETIAGLSFGLATLVKPYGVLFVPYLLATNRWRAAAAATAATVAVLLLPAITYGVRGTRDLTVAWWRTATDTSAPLLTNADAVSVFAMYAKWIGWGTAAAGLSFATIGLLGVLFLVVLRHRSTIRRPEILEVGLGLTLIPLVTPQGWDYVLLLSLPLITLMMARFDRMPGLDRALFSVAVGVVALSLYDVMGRAAYARFMALSVITVCYLVIAGLAARLRLRGAA